MRLKYVLFILALFFILPSASGQLLNKLKQKVEEETEKAVSGKNKNQNSSSSETNSAGASSKKTNSKGGGLVTTPPDVKQNLADAETSFKTGKYGEARYAVQQAMLGVEMEIGQEILKTLPESISGLKKISEEDQVTSTGWGWAGLTIQRRYSGNEDKELTLTVANNSVWMTAANAYLANGSYSQTTGGEQNWKQTKVKGHKAIIEFDESSGYKLSVPLGQSSILVYEGVNFSTEQEMMSAANAVDIDAIKKKLGEK
jgi:hypothetical protein